MADPSVSAPVPSASAFTAAELAALDLRFAANGGEPAEVIEWFAASLPLDQVCVASAMTSDVVLIDVVSRIIPGIEVVFLDTGYHFPETLVTLESVGRRYPVRLAVQPAPPIGDRRYERDPDGCCHERKVVPLERALEGKAGWVSGVRRSDSAVRAETPFVHLDRRGLVKINPLAAWSDDDLATYALVHEVPMNPLLAEGYPSIGCWPCTRKPADGEDARAGRWSGQAKTECGLHV
jgi:phosphoadenosine phosphosulfate reductase